MKLDPKHSVLVLGASGMVGQAICRLLKKNSFQTVLTPDHEELDLTKQESVKNYFRSYPVDLVIVAAAKVGGILANSTYPASFLYENSVIALNTIHEAFAARIPRLLFLGSSCIYPPNAKQPIEPSALLTGPFESTNAAYGLAKTLGVEMCRYYNREYGVNYISAMPANLYGPGDNYDLRHSHVLPALIRRFHEAKNEGRESITLWGSGHALREFVHVDDLASALLHLLNHYDGADPVNIGSDQEVSILELAKLIADVVGYWGDIRFDHHHPDGAMRKKIDCSQMKNMGWVPSISLEEGLESVYQEFKSKYPYLKGIAGTKKDGEIFTSHFCN